MYFPDGAGALDFLLERIPAGATVMNGGSTTVEQIGFVRVLQEGRYAWPRPGIKAIDDAGNEPARAGVP